MPERYAGVDLAGYTEIEARRREVVTELERRRQERNRLTAGKQRPSPEQVAEIKRLKEEI